MITYYFVCKAWNRLGYFMILSKNAIFDHNIDT